MDSHCDIHKLTIHQWEAIVNGRIQSWTLLELGKQFNVLEKGVSKFLKRWNDQGEVLKVHK